MQPGEFYQLYDGYLWRREQQESLFAYFICQLLNISGKSLRRPVSPQDLIKPLRRPGPQRSRRQDEEYLKERFRAILGKGG